MQLSNFDEKFYQKKSLVYLKLGALIYRLKPQVDQKPHFLGLKTEVAQQPWVENGSPMSWLNGACATPKYVIVHTILGGSPVILLISLGGQNGFH